MLQGQRVPPGSGGADGKRDVLPELCVRVRIVSALFFVNKR